MAGDVVLVKRKVTGWRDLRRWLVSWLIRAFSTTASDKARTQVNHAATVLGPGLRWGRCGAMITDDYTIGEALGSEGYVYKWLREKYAKRQYELAIFRRKDLTARHRQLIALAAEHLHGKKYGWFKIALHVVDYALTGLWNACGGRGDVYLARRLCKSMRYPMCSWAVLYEYKKAGVPFRVPVEAGQPDDIWDECLADPVWQVVFFTDGLAAPIGDALEVRGGSA